MCDSDDGPLFGLGAAQLTIENGRDYFRVLGGDTDVRTINVFIPSVEDLKLSDLALGRPFQHAHELPGLEGTWISNCSSSLYTYALSKHHMFAPGWSLQPKLQWPAFHYENDRGFH